MKEKYYDLDPNNKAPIVKLLQVAFGILCTAATLYYFFSGIMTGFSEVTLLTALLFLLFFGIYQIMSGLGKTKKYIRLTLGSIAIKQHSVLPAANIQSDKIDRIELYPLSIKFFLKHRKRFKFRFGISYPEIIDPVKQEVIGFADDHGIPWIEVPEEI